MKVKLHRARKKLLTTLQEHLREETCTLHVHRPILRLTGQLRYLFVQAGPLQVPDDLEARVPRQLGAQPAARVVEDKPLMATCIWMVMGALLLGLILYSLLTPVAVDIKGSAYQRSLPSFALPRPGNVLRSPRTLMGKACTAAFPSLEAYLLLPSAVRSGR